MATYKIWLIKTILFSFELKRQAKKKKKKKKEKKKKKKENFFPNDVERTADILIY